MRSNITKSPNTVKAKATRADGLRVATPNAAKRAIAMRGIVAKRNLAMKKGSY